MSTGIKTVLLVAAILSLSLAFEPVSHAALTAVGPVDPATGFPAYYQDATGLSLAPCFDNNGFCTITMVAQPGFDPALPIVIPLNFPGEGFYFFAQAGFTDPIMIYIAALEFTGKTPETKVTFARIRIRNKNVLAGTITVTHPYGVDMIDADLLTGINFTEDIGPAAGVFTGALAGRIGPFIKRAAGLLTAPDGNVYIGDSITAVPVTGTPVTSVTIAGTISATTNTFVLEGKVTEMSVAPTSITFPVQKPAIDSAPVPVTVANLSTVSTLTIASIVPQWTNAVDFRIVDVNCLTAPIAPGDVCTFNVIFNGAAEGPAVRTGSILISATLATVPKVAAVPVSCTIDTTPPVVGPHIIVTDSVAPVDDHLVPFGNHMVNTTTDATITITSTGTETLNISMIAMTDPLAAPFSIVNNTCSGTSLLPAAICTLTVRYAPTGNINSVDTFDIMSNDGGSPVHMVTVSGTGVPVPAPHITVTDSVAPADDWQVPFGSVNQGGTLDKTATITNSGNADLIIGTITSENPFTSSFRIAADPCSGKTIASAGSCTLSIRFAPAVVGTFTDTFDIPSNDSHTLVVAVSVSGTGTPIPVPDIAVTDSVFPESDLKMPFGNVTQGVSSLVQTINITNAGIAALTVSKIQLTGTDSSQFSLNLGGGASPCTTASPTVAVGGNCTATVIFNPLSTGAKSANIVISSNDPDEATVSVALTGTGLPASTNNAPSVPALIYPANGQAGLGTSFTCRWKKAQDPEGDTVAYRVYYCTDRNFSNCPPDTAANFGTSKIFFAYTGLPGLLLIGAIFAVPLSGRKKFMLLMISLIMFGGVVVSCGGGGSGGGETAVPVAADEASHLMSGLKSATTYYWKVAADDGKGGIEESPVWSFSTQ